MATTMLPTQTTLARRISAATWRRSAFALLMVAFAAVLIHAAWWDTPSMDEMIHIPAGMTYLDLGDPRMNFEHPPLMKLLAGAGAALAGAHVDSSIPGWTTSDEVALRLGFQDRFARPELRRIVFCARLPMIGLSLLLAAAVYFYARSLAGAAGGLFSLALFVTHPVVLAFGAAVLNDIAVTLGCLLTCAAIVRLWERPSPSSGAIYGCALGFALLAKFSALVLLPLSFLCWGVLLIRDPGSRVRESLRRLPSIAAGLGVAFLIVWSTYFIAFRRADARSFAAGYFQEEVPQPGTAAYSSARKRVQLFAQLEQHPALERTLMPVFYYGAGVRFVIREASRPVYLLGRRYPSGQWFYFPVLALTKSSPGFLGLMLLGTALLARPGTWRHASPRAIVPALFLLVYTAVALHMRLNIGLRHYMPGLVGITVLLAQLMRAPRRRRLVAGTALVCLGSAFWVAVAQYPYYLPYFNFLAEGRPAGWIASDSNVDFGMSLRAADEFAAEHRLDAVAVVPFQQRPYRLRAWLSAGRSWSCASAHLPPGPYVIVSEHRFYDPRAPHECDYLLRYPHRPLAGGSLEVFTLGPQ